MSFPVCLSVLFLVFKADPQHSTIKILYTTSKKYIEFYPILKCIAIYRIQKHRRCRFSRPQCIGDICVATLSLQMNSKNKFCGAATFTWGRITSEAVQAAYKFFAFARSRCRWLYSRLCCRRLSARSSVVRHHTRALHGPNFSAWAQLGPIIRSLGAIRNRDFNF